MSIILFLFYYVNNNKFFMNFNLNDFRLLLLNISSYLTFIIEQFKMIYFHKH